MERRHPLGVLLALMLVVVSLAATFILSTRNDWTIYSEDNTAVLLNRRTGVVCVALDTSDVPFPATPAVWLAFAAAGDRLRWTCSTRPSDGRWILPAR